MLLGTRPGYADTAAAGNRESYRRGAVSLPSSRAGQIGISTMLPPDLQNQLETGHGLLRSEGAVVAALEEVGDACFMDARVARLGQDYGHLLKELHAAGIIEQCVELLEFAGVFFVKRKDAKQRLIFDTRRPNCHFEEPSYTELASGESFAGLEAAAGQPIHLASGDVEVCFYQYSLPEALRPYFGLKPIRDHMLPKSLANKLDRSLMVGGRAFFRVRVVPMGWSWSVFFVQTAHTFQMRSVRPEDPWLIDKRPCSCVEAHNTSKVLYIDNFAALSGSRQMADDTVHHMKRQLEEKGVRSDIEDDPTDLLGFSLDARRGWWRPTGKKFWRIHGCLTT